MNKSGILLILFPLLTFPGIVFSAVSETAVVEGKITGFDMKTATLLIQKGKRKTKIKVPRKSIPKYFKIKIGNKVRAVLNGKELWKKIKKRKKRKNKKRKKR